MATLEKKKADQKEIVDLLKASDAVYLTDYKNMSVAQINKLRREFRNDGITYKVFKNTIVKRAMEEVGGYDKVFELLENQSAFAFVSGDPARPAKILKSFLKENKNPEFKGAVIEGALFEGDKLEALSSMKTKEEVIGDIIGLLLAPITNIVGGLQAQGSNILGAVKTIAEKDN
jgi:large subunit ribosomal protein L10